MNPQLGSIVWYRSRTGNYNLAAIVTATQDTLWPVGVERGDVEPLSSERHVHLFVFSPSCLPAGGSPGTPAPGYEEYDVPFHNVEEYGPVVPGTWSWAPPAKDND